MRSTNSIGELCNLLPGTPSEKQRVEQAIVYQLLIAKDHALRSQDETFWKSLLDAYSSRSVEVILGQAGLNTLAGMGGVKHLLRKRVINLYLSQDKNAPSFVLFHGPPGGGKSVTAKKLAEELGYDFVSVSYGDLSENEQSQGLSYGAMAQRVADAFRNAKTHAPCVLFLDELSSIARIRAGSYVGNDASVTTDALLQEFNSVKAHNQHPANMHKKVLVVGALNHITEADSAIIDRALKIYFPSPDQKQTKAIAIQKLKEAFQDYDITAESYSLIDQIADMISLASPDSTRSIESIVIAIASTSANDNNRVVTIDIVKRELLAELGIVESNMEDPHEDWYALANELTENNPKFTPSNQHSISSLLSQPEYALMNKLLPETEAFRKTTIVQKGLFDRLLRTYTQNKLEFAVRALSLITPLVVGVLGVAVVSGALPATALIASSITLQGLQSAISGLGLNPSQKLFQAIGSRLDTLKESVSTKLEAESKGQIKPSLRFGSNQPQHQEAAHSTTTSANSSDSQNSAQEIQSSLDNIKEMVTLFASNLSRPKLLLSLTQGIMSELVEIAYQAGATDRFKHEIDYSQTWLKYFYEFKSNVPEQAETFADLSPELRTLYREIIFKALISNISHLQEWGAQEAKRLGYSKSMIDGVIALSTK